MNNRVKRPWIITMGHRLMYCSNDDGDDCAKNESVVSWLLLFQCKLQRKLSKHSLGACAFAEICILYLF